MPTSHAKNAITTYPVVALRMTRELLAEVRAQLHPGDTFGSWVRDAIQERLTGSSPFTPGPKAGRMRTRRTRPTGTPRKGRSPRRAPRKARAHAKPA